VAYVRKAFLAKIIDVSYPIPVELPVTTATLWLAEEEEEEEDIYVLAYIDTLYYLSKQSILWLLGKSDLTYPALFDKPSSKSEIFIE
jgi:hypothetical protein